MSKTMKPVCECSICQMLAATNSRQPTHSELLHFIDTHDANYHDLHFRDFEQGLKFTSVTYMNRANEPVNFDSDEPNIDYFIYNDNNLKPVAWFSPLDWSGAK